MEEETKAISEVSVTKVIEEVDQKDVNIKESLNSVLSEKEVITAEVVSLKNLPAESNDIYSKSSEIHSDKETSILKAEPQLQEALLKKESETKELNEKLNTLEEQIKIYEEQIREAVATSESRKAELEESIKHFKAVVEELQNKSLDRETETAGKNEEKLKPVQEIAIYESKLSDLQSKLSAAPVEKNETVKEILASKNAAEDLMKKHSEEVQTLKSQGEEGVDKSKKMSESTAPQTSSYLSETRIEAGHESRLINFKFMYHEYQDGHDSPIVNFKFILGVALVSIIFGIILVKRF